MKRFGRIFSGIAAIMLGVGIILVAVGIGRARAEWNAAEGPGDAGSVSREFERADQLELKLPYGMIRIEGSAENTIRFHAENISEEKLDMKSGASGIEISMRAGEQEPGELNLFFVNIPFFGIGSFKGIEEWEDAPVFVLTVPEDYGGRIRAEVAFGRIQVFGLQASGLTLETGFGEIWVDDCDVAELRLEAETGALRAEGCTVERAGAECKAGNILLEGDFGNLVAENGMGEIELFPGRKQDAYHGNISVVFGQIHCSTVGRYGNLGRREGFGWGGGMDIGLPGGGAGELRASCKFGNVEITFQE